MAVHEHTAALPHFARTGPDRSSPPGVAPRSLATLRITTGLIFVWAFLDKAFGLGYATPSGSAWINGGSPAAGYLSGVQAGPLESFFHSLSGQTWVDWMYMAGMLGLGLTLVAGVGLRVTAVAGSGMMLMLWASQWPAARTLSDGSPSMSPNPVIDQHIIYAGVMIAVAVCAAGHTWGLGRPWAATALVRRNPWLR